MSRFDTGGAIHERRAEFLSWFTDRFSLLGHYTRAERGALSIEEAELTAHWRITDDGRFGAELRHVREQAIGVDGEALLAAVRYRHRIGASLEVFSTGQVSTGEQGNYARNKLATVGARYLFGNRSSLGAEVSGGSRGHGGKVDGEYRIDDDHSVYGAWNYSTDTTRDALFDTSMRNGWTLGQRWRLNDQVNLYNESQYLKDTQQGSTGIAHTLGMDFFPVDGWTLGFTVQDGELDATTGRVDRRADAGWTFPSNHTHVLVCPAADGEQTLREVAEKVGVTERAVQRIVAELAEAGVLQRERDGRRNTYMIRADTPLRHQLEAHCDIGDLLGMVVVHPATPLTTSQTTSQRSRAKATKAIREATPPRMSR